MSLQTTFIPVDPDLQDVRRFRCGQASLDEFLIKHATKNARLGLSMTWVLLDNEHHGRKKSPVAAYYTLASSTVAREVLSSSQLLPPYPVPVTLLARLAVATPYQGLGLGSKTLVTAVRQAVKLSNHGLPSFGLVLDVLNEEALRFYQHFQAFQPFSDDPMRLFLPMRIAEEL